MGVSRSWEDTGVTRYGVILERAPFGRVPALLSDQAVPAAPGDSFATYIRLTAMIRGEDGVVRVGFVNTREKDQTFLLAVGEQVGDFNVLEADIENELVRVQKGNEVQWLSLRSVGPAQPPPGWTDQGTSVLSFAAPAVPVPPSPSAGAAGDRRQSRYAAIRRAQIEREREQEERRRQAQLAAAVRPPPPDGEEEEDEAEAETLALTIARVNQEQTDDEEAEDEEGILVSVPPPGDGEEDDDLEEEDEEIALREAEIQAHLQRYQMELIRQGLPPLPVRLTPENDAALVREGVLPPLPEEDGEEDLGGDQGEP